MADLDPSLVARATAVGLTRGRSWWDRKGYYGPALLWERLGRWYWVPESSSHNPALFRGPFDEAEALSSALDWIEAGEPLPVPR